MKFHPLIRLFFSCLGFLLFLESSAFATCFGILFASHVPQAKIEGPFIKGLASTHTGLLKRGCKASDIKVFVGDGQARQMGMFLKADLKSKFESGLVDVASRFPGSALAPATTQNLETAVMNVSKAAKPGDELYVQVTGHSYSAYEFPSYDNKVVTQEFGQWLSSLPTFLKTRVIFDVCFAGSILDFVDSPSVCAFASSDKASYAKYSFMNTYSLQMGMALQDPRNSLLQSHLRSVRRDPTPNSGTSTLQQLIRQATGAVKTEAIISFFNAEASKNSTLIGQLIDTVYTKSYYANRLDHSRPDYTNPIATLKDMRSFPAFYLIERYKVLLAMKAKTEKDWIQAQDIEMALRLQYMNIKGSVMNRKRFTEVANCMGEKL